VRQAAAYYVWSMTFLAQVSRKQLLSEDERATVEALRDRHGERGAARVLGVHRGLVARVLDSQRQLTPGSLLLVRLGLERLTLARAVAAAPAERSVA
jgi:hypothetical protein